MFDIFEVKEVGNKLVVVVEVPLGERFGPTRVALRTNKLLKILAEKKIAHGECVEEAYVRSWREETRRGEWIFELPERPKKAAPRKVAKPRVAKPRVAKPKVVPEAE